MTSIRFARTAVPAATVALALSMLMAGCRGTKSKPIPLTTHAPASQTTEPSRNDKAILVAMAPILSPKETLSAYSGLVDYIGEQLHRPARVVQTNSYSDTNEMIREGLCDVAFVCSLPYVAGKKDFGLQALVIPQVGGNTTYRCYIIVPADSSAGSLLALKGRSFAFVDPLSNTGRLAPVHMLRHRGVNPDRFFSRTIYTHSHDNSIRAVADGLVEGAAVSDLAYQFMAEQGNGTKGTKVIEKSEPFGMPPVVVPPHIDPQLKAELRTVFLNMHRSPRGRVILKKLRFDKFLLPDKSSYQSLRRMQEAEGLR